MKQKIFAVVATSENRAIGHKGWLPWPEMKCDYERLMTLAYHKPAVMGRLSYESPNQFLSNNQNLIITSHKIDDLPDNCTTVSSIEEALKYYENEPEICILGGQRVFESFMPYLTHIYLTLIHTVAKADTYFPEISNKDWQLINQESFYAGEGNPLDYEFLEYQKVKE
ncbi:MAG: dihydrofolate reductase [Winogradskyella sp.]